MLAVSHLMMLSHVIMEPDASRYQHHVFGFQPPEL